MGPEEMAMGMGPEDRDEMPPSLKIVPTAFPISPPLEECLDHFWSVGPAFDRVEARVGPKGGETSILEQLGPSPFPRGGFPVVGFLATTYDRVSAFVLSLVNREASGRPESDADGR